MLFTSFALETANSALCLQASLPLVVQAAAILSGQDVTKKKRARSPARHQGSLPQGILQCAPHTPGLVTDFELLPPECIAQPQEQLLQPAQIAAVMPQDLISQTMYQSPTPSHHQRSSAQLNPMRFAQAPQSHAEPALTAAEEACLLRLGTQAISHQSTVSSQQVPRQLHESWAPKSVFPAKPPMSQLSPVSSRQLPAQLPTQLPVLSPATSRDPRRPSYCGGTVTATSSDLAKGSSPMEGLQYSPYHAQDSEPRPPASPTQSDLFATLLMPDSPDATSSDVNAEDALAQTSSPAGRSTPDIDALSHLPPQHQLSESPLSLLDALLSDSCKEADFALGNGDDDFTLGQEDSDYAMLSEAIQMTGQHAQHAQHDAVVSPQMLPVPAACQDTLQAPSPLSRASSSMLSSQAFSLPQAVTVSGLQEHFPASKSHLPAASENTSKPLKRRWPESPPYTICRWQLLVMQ